MKILVSLGFVVGTVAIILLGFPTGNTDRDFLRFHIRANSNAASDQAVKYTIQQSVINDFTPMFSNITTMEDAMSSMRNNLRRIEAISNEILISYGKTYTARASLQWEHFPTRNYRDVTLPEGFYNAVIIELGAGLGDNWWCVIYPPLCFLQNNIGGNQGVVYRSRLNEIINRFFR